MEFENVFRGVPKEEGARVMGGINKKGLGLGATFVEEQSHFVTAGGGNSCRLRSALVLWHSLTSAKATAQCT